VILNLHQVFAGYIGLAVLVYAQMIIVIDLAIVAGGPVQVNVTDTAPDGPGHAPQFFFVNLNRIFYEMAFFKHSYHAPFTFNFSEPPINSSAAGRRFLTPTL
jgi:hypothetical protein